MRFLCLYQSADAGLVRAQVQSEPKSLLDKETWTLRLTADCETSAPGTADVLLRYLEWRFAAQLEAPGLIRAPYADLRQQLLDFVHYAENRGAAATQTASVAPAASGPPAIATDQATRSRRSPHGGHGAGIRVAAGVLALALFVASVSLQVYAWFLWFFIIAFRQRRRSPLYTAAEFAYVCTILDWSPTIHKLGRVALGQQRLWRATWR